MADIAFIDVTATVSYGGVQTAIWQLARALHDAGHRVTVYGGAGDIRPDLGERNIAVQTFAFTPRDRVINLGSRFRRWWERRSLARNAQATVIAARHDWVILTKPFDFFWPHLMPPQHPTRFAFMSGGTDFMRGDRKKTAGISAWMACSHFNAWQIQARYKHFPQVIYNGVDTAQFAPTVAAADRSQWQVSDDDVLFGFAGRLVGWKGLRFAIAALAEPPLREQPVKLLIVGDGEDLPKLQRLATDLAVLPRVIFHPPVAHAALPALYAACDAGVFPSIGDEAFGITIAEAMACGKPVVANHIGGIPEVVGNEGSCGLLVTPGDTGGLAAAMAKLAADHSLRLRLGNAARQRILDCYTWTQAADRLTQALQKAENIF